MYTPDPFVIERRTALVRAARRVQDEAGPDNVCLVDPVLAAELVSAVAEDIAGHITDRMARGMETLDEFVHELIEAVMAAGEPWKDALLLVAVAVERVTDFAQWIAIVGPWIDAIERGIIQAQRQGLVREDVDPRSTALILRDTMQRISQYGQRFGHDCYVEMVKRVVIAGLRPAE
jgi:hypothetical protein